MWRQIQMSPVMTNNNWGVLQEKAIFIYWITSHQLIKESSWCQEQTPDMMITYTEWKRSPFFNNPWPSCHLYTSLTYRSICSHLCIAIALQSWDQGEGLFSFSFFFSYYSSTQVYTRWFYKGRPDYFFMVHTSAPGFPLILALMAGFSPSTPFIEKDPFFNSVLNAVDGDPLPGACPSLLYIWIRFPPLFLFKWNIYVLMGNINRGNYFLIIAYISLPTYKGNFFG